MRDMEEEKQEMRSSCLSFDGVIFVFSFYLGAVK